MYLVLELLVARLAARGADGGPGKKPREPGPHEPLLLDGDAPWVHTHAQTQTHLHTHSNM